MIDLKLKLPKFFLNIFYLILHKRGRFAHRNAPTLLLGTHVIWIGIPAEFVNLVQDNYFNQTIQREQKELTCK